MDRRAVYGRLVGGDALFADVPRAHGERVSVWFAHALNTKFATQEDLKTSAAERRPQFEPVIERLKQEEDIQEAMTAVIVASFSTEERYQAAEWLMSERVRGFHPTLDDSISYILATKEEGAENKERIRRAYSLTASFARALEGISDRALLAKYLITVGCNLENPENFQENALSFLGKSIMQKESVYFNVFENDDEALRLFKERGFSVDKSFEENYSIIQAARKDKIRHRALNILAGGYSNIKLYKNQEEFIAIAIDCHLGRDDQAYTKTLERMNWVATVHYLSEVYKTLEDPSYRVEAFMRESLARGLTRAATNTQEILDEVDRILRR
ncbi:MAG: hypothetical protein FJX18_05640 [Alphaproteobacteria bacterium]|nr:hypothetical protein [Alphaproteobacteria bacterium]